MEYLQAQEVKMPEIKVWNGQRVVTFKDIDEVHGRKTGTASANFKRNKKYFQEGKHYYIIKKSQCNGTLNTIENLNVKNIPPKGLTVFTERGYLMIVKTFTDDLSWIVQDQLVENYFKNKENIKADLPAIQQSFTKVPKRIDWFLMNYEKIERVKIKKHWDNRKLYRNILLRLDGFYDIDAANQIYRNEVGYYPVYAMDIVSYFPELLNQANKILDDFLYQ